MQLHEISERIKKPIQIKNGRYFPNMAKLCFAYREAAQLSQIELSEKIGFRNGQFISNIERGLCSVPRKKAKIFCEALNLSHDIFITAYLADEHIFIKSGLSDEV